MIGPAIPVIYAISAIGDQGYVGGCACKSISGTGVCGYRRVTVVARGSNAMQHTYYSSPYIRVFQNKGRINGAVESLVSTGWLSPTPCLLTLRCPVPTNAANINQSQTMVCILTCILSVRSICACKQLHSQYVMYGFAPCQPQQIKKYTKKASMKELEWPHWGALCIEKPRKEKGEY